MNTKILGLLILTLVALQSRVSALDILSENELFEIQGGYSCPCTKMKTGSMCNVNIFNGCKTILIAPKTCDPHSMPHGTACYIFLQGYPQKHDECGSVDDAPSGCDLDPNGDACVKYQDGFCFQTYAAENGNPTGCPCQVAADPTPKNSGNRTTASGDPC